MKDFIQRALGLYLKNIFFKKYEHYLPVSIGVNQLLLYIKHNIQDRLSIIWECSALGWTYVLPCNCFPGFVLLVLNGVRGADIPVLSLPWWFDWVLFWGWGAARIVYDYKSQTSDTSKEMTSTTCWLYDPKLKPEMDLKYCSKYLNVWNPLVQLNYG